MKVVFFEKDSQLRQSYAAEPKLSLNGEQCSFQRLFFFFAGRFPLRWDFKLARSCSECMSHKYSVLSEELCALQISILELPFLCECVCVCVCPNSTQFSFKLPGVVCVCVCVCVCVRLSARLTGLFRIAWSSVCPPLPPPKVCAPTPHPPMLSTEVRIISVYICRQLSIKTSTVPQEGEKKKKKKKRG